MGLIRSPVRPTGPSTPVIAITPTQSGVQVASKVNILTPKRHLPPLQRGVSSPRAVSVNNQPSVPFGTAGLSIMGIRPLDHSLAVPSVEAYAALQNENQRLCQRIADLRLTVTAVKADNLLLKRDALVFEAAVLTLRQAMDGELGDTARLVSFKETIDRKLFFLLGQFISDHYSNLHSLASFQMARDCLRLPPYL